MSDIVWTEDRIAEMMRRWDAGESGSIIAAALGNGIIRSAVIGKIHRLRTASGVAKPQLANISPPHAVASRHQPSAPVAAFPVPSNDGVTAVRRATLVRAAPRSAPTYRSPLRPAQAKGVKPVAVAPMIMAETRAIALVVPPRPENRITVFTLQPDQCKWPIGDPRDQDFTFCGARQAEGRVYCQYHVHASYEPRKPPVKRPWGA